jgi:hypothetical protein
LTKHWRAAPQFGRAPVERDDKGIGIADINSSWKYLDEMFRKPVQSMRVGWHGVPRECAPDAIGPWRRRGRARSSWESYGGMTRRNRLGKYSDGVFPAHMGCEPRVFAVDIFAAVRTFVSTEGNSRHAARMFGPSRDTVVKTRRHSTPPAYVNPRFIIYQVDRRAIPSSLRAPKAIGHPHGYSELFACRK